MPFYSCTFHPLTFGLVAALHHRFSLLGCKLVPASSFSSSRTLLSCHRCIIHAVVCFSLSSPSALPSFLSKSYISNSLSLLPFIPRSHARRPPLHPLTTHSRNAFPCTCNSTRHFLLLYFIIRLSALYLPRHEA